MEFLRLVRRWTPDLEHDVASAHEMQQKVQIFAESFSERYFPLHPCLREGDVEEYEQVIGSIPVDIYGRDYDIHEQVHNIDPAFALMLYLAKWAERDEVEVSLTEYCRQSVPDDILRKAPALPREELHRLLDGTDYEGVACWADWWENDTGSILWDVSWEEASYYQSSWDDDEVLWLTEDFQRGLAKQKKADQVAQWLNENPADNFKKLIDFIQEKVDHGPKDKGQGARPVPMGNPGGTGDPAGPMAVEA